VTASVALARHRLSRANAALKEADILIAQDQFSGALNRLYYAAFYAARALLALHHADSPRHTGVISLFQQHFVKTRIVAEEVARVLPKAFAKRQISDYGDFTEATADEVRPLREDVERFVSACEAALPASET
jgi:uncharacterized protein (UPF0332 family)